MHRSQEVHLASLEELTASVREAPTTEAKVTAFGDWLLKVVGIDGVHGSEAVNEVLKTEFGPQASLSPDQIRTSQRYLGIRYREGRNGELYRDTR